MPSDRTLKEPRDDDIDDLRVRVAQQAASLLRMRRWHWPLDDCQSYASLAACEQPAAMFLACGTPLEPELVQTVSRRADTLGRTERQERRKVRPVRFSEASVPEPVATTDDQEAPTEVRDLLETAQDLIEVAIDQEAERRKLPRETVATVWRMKVVEGRTYREIEAATGIDKSTASRMVNSIRDRVARHFDWYRELNISRPRHSADETAELTPAQPEERSS